MVRKLLLLAGALLALTAAPAAAQYGTGPTLGVSSGTVVMGAQVTVSGSGFAPGESVALTLGRPCGSGDHSGVAVGSAVASASGAITTAVTIPVGTPAGTYGIHGVGPSTATCSDIVVAAAGTSTGGVGVVPGGLARTGTSSTVPLAVAGAAALATGGLLLTAARRRRSASA